MSRTLAASIGSFRLAAVAVAFGAVGLLVARHPDNPNPPATIITESEAAEAQERIWSVRTDGWVLRVDGADVVLPTVTEHIATLPKLVPHEPRLSPFDHVIKRHAAANGFDWRLIAAVIFEESRFRPNSRSPKGAFGLMQVRDIAADAVGEHRFRLPEDNIRTGVRYLAQLEQMFGDVRPRDRRRFVLAAYNMGPGHVTDAQALARRLGYDALRWEGGLRETLPLLEEPRYYDTLPLGYAQGRNVVRYVDLVLHRFRHYQRLTASAALEELAAIAEESEAQEPEDE
jgi:membrane-bound lytic murein transglycosylase MltF